MTTLEQRVEKMEQSLSRWRRAAFGLGLVVVVIGTVAASHEEAVPEYLETKTLVIVNDDGEVVAKMGNSVGLGGSLVVYGEAGEESFMVDPGWLGLRNQSGELIFAVQRDSNADRRDNGLLYLQDSSGELILMAGQDGEGKGFLEVHDQDGKSNAYGAAAPEYLETKTLVVVNDDGKAVAEITGGDWGGSIAVYNEAGEPSFTVDPGRLGLNRVGGDPIFGVESGDWGSLLTVYNQAGEPSFGVEGGDQGGSLRILDEAAETSFAVYPGTLELNNEGGNRIFAVEQDRNADAAGNGLLYLQDRSGELILMAGQNGEGEGFLAVHDQNGKSTAYGATPPDYLETKTLVVVNDDGEMAAQLTANDWGGSLAVYNEAGEPSFTVDPGSFALRNESGEVIFGVERDGNAGSLGNGLLYLRNSSGGPIFMAGQDGEGYGFLQVHDEDGTNTMLGPAWR